MYVGLRQFLRAAPPLFQSPDPPIQKGGLDETPWPGHSHHLQYILHIRETCTIKYTHKKYSVADPDPGSGVFSTPGSQTHIFESLVTIFGVKSSLKIEPDFFSSAF